MATPGAPAGEPTDAELLRAHVDGDPDAFGRLVARHRDRAWAVALRTVGNPADAEDAVQEAFVSALRAAPRFRYESSVGTWLHRIVVNACLDRLRREAARPHGPLEQDLPAGGDAFAARETALEVAAALRRLPTEQRAAIVLVELAGLPVTEAAEVLGVPAGTVKSRCSRGRARLAVLLGHLRPGNPAPAGGVTTPTGPADEGRGPC